MWRIKGLRPVVRQALKPAKSWDHSSRTFLQETPNILQKEETIFVRVCFDI